MKKLILLASAALAFGGVASAQDATQPPATGNATPDMGAQPPATGNSPDATGGMSTPPAGGDTSGGASQGGMQQGGGMQGGAMQGGMSGGAGAAPGSATGPNGPVSMTPTQGPTDLPTCSKSVTDNCKQGAGSGKSGGHHRAMRHHKK